MSPSSSSKERAKSLLLFLIFCNILFLQCTSFIQKPVTFNPVHGKIQIALHSRISRLCETANDGNGCLPIFDDRKRLKVLCLHGYLSSSKYFRLQLRRLVDEASDISEFVFLDGPHRFGLLKQPQPKEAISSTGTVTEDNLDAAISSPAGKFRWWYASESRGGDEGFDEAVQYEGLRESLVSIAMAERDEGPFDIVLGHSQGACLVVAMDCLRTRPDFDETEKEEQPTEKLTLPDAALSIVIGGFVPRDQIFDTLFASIEKDSSMNGLPQKSLHLFSHEDSIVPAEASMQAMYLYENPKMMIREGDHDPDDRAVDQVLKALKSSWFKKFSPPLVLEG